MADPGDTPARAIEAIEAIEALLRPRSIAIAGASSDPGKLGSMPLNFLLRHGYRGRMYPVHPRLDEIAGLPCRRAVADIEGDVDLLVVAVPAARIGELLDGCRPGQVKAAIILSSGFAEIGAEGEQLQRELQARARAKGIRFVGPNSVGLSNLHDKVVPSIAQVFDQAGLLPGPVAFVTQSGAVGTAITALAHAEQLGIGYFLSTGNEGDLEFSHFCAGFAADPAVRIVAGYVESIRDGARFRAAAAAAAQAGKPVVLIKVGASDAGGRAVQSHTGALAGSDAVYQAAFRQLGVIRVAGVEELVDVLKVLSAPPAAVRSRSAGRRVAILSHSGGAGVMMADACVAEGLEVAAPSATLAEALRRRLPPYASLQNPIDMTAGVIFDPALMAGVVRDVVHSGEFDAVLLCVNLIWRQGPALAAELAKLADDAAALVSVAWIAGRPEPVAQLNRSGIPVFPDPIRCVRAVAARLRWQAAEADAPGPAAAGAPAADATGDLGRFSVQHALLMHYGVALAPCELVADTNQALQAARRLGYPVAAKLAARGLAHKSEIGGVCLGIDSDESLARAVTRLESIPVAHREGVVLQPMVQGPLELIVGMQRDPVFGPVIVVGLGGIYVEVFRETVMRLAPVSHAQAGRLLREAKFFPLLDGARGKPPLDVDALAALIASVSRLAMNESRVLSLDLNPVMVLEAGVQVVDFKIECA